MCLKKQKIICYVYGIKFQMMYVAAPRKMCRKISKFDYAPNLAWQVAEVGERVGRWYDINSTVQLSFKFTT